MREGQGGGGTLGGGGTRAAIEISLRDRIYLNRGRAGRRLAREQGDAGDRGQTEGRIYERIAKVMCGGM